jgi:hypothetical protein
VTLPRQIGSAQSEAERARWRVVRLDSYASLEGQILHADVDTGVAVMARPGPDGAMVQTTYNLGPGGFAIVAR